MTDRPTDHVDECIDLLDAITALPSRQRRAVALYYDGYTQIEIAEVMGIDQSSVSRLLEKAIHTIKNAYFD